MKKRLDLLLVECGLATGRDKAKALVMSGSVYVNGEKALKPGEEVDETLPVEVRGETLRYVSRGGLKLEKALETFALNLCGTVCADIGASTGGFTDCMLQNGAARVYAVDVGYGQLAWQLRSDERVVVMERQNARYLTKNKIPEPLDLITIDASFISLTLLLPVAKELLGEEGAVICLIKPQFEAGRDKVGKKGVVRDPNVHKDVVESVIAFAQGIGFHIAGLSHSPVKGPQGNIEYLLYLRRKEQSCRVDRDVIAQVVDASHEQLWGNA